MPWKDIAARFQTDLQKSYQIPALQMRYKRLRERMRVWTDTDRQALRMAHEYWAQNKFEIIAQKVCICRMIWNVPLTNPTDVGVRYAREMDSTAMLTSMANDGSTNNVISTVRTRSARLCSVRHESHRAATQQLSTLLTQLMSSALSRCANKEFCSRDPFLLLHYLLHGSTQQTVQPKYQLNAPLALCAAAQARAFSRNKQVSLHRGRFRARAVGKKNGPANTQPTPSSGTTPHTLHITILRLIPLLKVQP